MLLGRSMRRFNRFHAFMVVAGLFFITLVVYHRADTNADGYDTKDATMRNAHVKNSHMRNRDGEANDNADTNDATDLVHYRRETPLIWIGGVPRSGTTLMRAMLDAHEDVRCGEETRVIPRVLGMHAGMTKSELEMTRLKEAHIDENVLNSALGAYILSIIALHGEPAARLCNKDPFTLRSMSRLSTIFPNSKYLLMIRDGRATAHSIISRKVTIKGFDIKTYRGALKDWNRAIESMYNECQKAGEDTCLPVHYEQLVLHPESQMRRISEFLDLPWDENVLHHEKMVGGEVSLSKKELSTDQVDKPVNTGALAKWVDDIPQDVKDEMAQIAPMLQKLGYDPHANPPNYGTPDKAVVDNTKLVARGVKAPLIAAHRNIRQ